MEIYRKSQTLRTARLLLQVFIRPDQMAVRDFSERVVCDELEEKICYLGIGDQRPLGQLGEDPLLRVVEGLTLLVWNQALVPGDEILVSV